MEAIYLKIDTGSNVPKNPCGKELLWVQPKLNHCTDGCAQSLQAMVEKQDGLYRQPSKVICGENCLGSDI